MQEGIATVAIGAAVGCGGDQQVRFSVLVEIGGGQRDRIIGCCGLDGRTKRAIAVAQQHVNRRRRINGSRHRDVHLAVAVEVGEGQRDAVIEDRGKARVQYAGVVSAIALVKQHTDGAVGVSGDDVELAIAVDVDQIDSLLLRGRAGGDSTTAFLNFPVPKPSNTATVLFWQPAKVASCSVATISALPSPFTSPVASHVTALFAQVLAVTSEVVPSTPCELPRLMPDLSVGASANDCAMSGNPSPLKSAVAIMVICA